MGRLFGLERSRRHAQAHWQMDSDYADSLGEADKEWLSRFLHEYYLSAPNSDKNVHSRELMRDCWRAHKRNKEDALTQAQFQGREEFDEAIAPQFDSPQDERPDHMRAISMAIGVWESRTQRRKMPKKERQKGLTAEEAGRMGGLKLASLMTREERRKSAQNAARERWFKAKKAWPEMADRDA